MIFFSPYYFPLFLQDSLGLDQGKRQLEKKREQSFTLTCAIVMSSSVTSVQLTLKVCFFSLRQIWEVFVGLEGNGRIWPIGSINCIFLMVIYFALPTIIIQPKVSVY